MKHEGSLSYSYWLKVIEIGAAFFDDEDKCLFHKIMEEEDYVQGNFSCEDFQKKISERFGKRVLTTFKQRAKGKLYPDEFSVFMNQNYTKINYPCPKKNPHAKENFYLDGPQPVMP